MDSVMPEGKRPRLSGPGWSASSLHVSLLHPTRSPTITQPPPLLAAYQPPSHSFSRPPEHHHIPQPHTHAQVSPLQPLPSSSGPAPAPTAHLMDDRRPQHEAEQRYLPMQEYRHPPVSPSDAPYSAYPRECALKSEPKTEDFLPHPSRPSGTVPPLEPSSHSYPSEEKRHTSFDNGSPAIYRHQSYPPPTPISQAQTYEYPPPYGLSQSEVSFGSIPMTGTTKRKAQRASQACDMCRQLKAKCDEMKPCKNCKEKKIECKYREAVPKQQDKISQEIMEYLVDLQRVLGVMNDRMACLERKMDRIVPGVAMMKDDLVTDEPLPPRPDSAPEAMDMDVHNQSTEDEDSKERRLAIRRAQAIIDSMDGDDPDVEPAHVPPGTPAIPVYHTTMNTLLLKWKSINSLVRPWLTMSGLRYFEAFALTQEHKRGILRVWGRGEGLDRLQGDRCLAFDNGYVELPSNSSESGAPSPADGWGGLGTSPGPVDAFRSRAIDLTEESIKKLVQSYKHNIQNMHPLIPPSQLDAMVSLFLEDVQQGCRKHTKSNTAAYFSTAAHLIGFHKAEKRKRPTPTLGGPASPSAYLSRTTRPLLNRTILNAVILTVLALGKVCLWKDKRLPDVVTDAGSLRSYSPLARNGHPPSPMRQNLPSALPPGPHPQSAAPSPTPPEGSDRSAVQGSGSGANKHKRNLDVIPGLDYFALATDIMGGHLAGTSLRHVWAFTLAGLYHGQLGRVLESYKHINLAGWALFWQMRTRLPTFTRVQVAMEKPCQTEEDLQLISLVTKNDNSILMAFWTLLQLESDIIAELPVPQSPVMQYEEMMPYPFASIASQVGIPETTMSSYLAQLYMRKRLNVIHRDFYGPDQPSHKLPSEQQIGEMNRSLNPERFLPPPYRFNLSEPPPPSTDFLAARIRAKYWGARVITFRPFVRHILESNCRKIHPELFTEEDAERAEHDLRASLNRKKGLVDKVPPSHQRCIDYAIMGIHALVESTQAFHGLPNTRFIVTNIFGTAHAQFGNLLTLSAAYKDPILHQYVDEETLRRLFIRTISMFHTIAQPSSSLNIDLQILQSIQTKLWPPTGLGVNRNSYPPTIDSSYSSSPSLGGGPPHCSTPRPGSITYVPVNSVAGTSVSRTAIDSAPPGTHSQSQTL